MVLEELQPKLVWQIFEELFIQTPRESKKEDKIREKLIQWVSQRAKDENLAIKVQSDKIGNVFLKVPAHPGYENLPALLLQGHMDMVCETDRPEGFDFDSLPIPAIIQENNEWVAADHTTLGADNGIGCALALALIFDPNVQHGPLEILLTVDEETGLTGAFNMDVEDLSIESRLLVNIDSEEINIITIGSAGGGDSEISIPITIDSHSADKELAYFQLDVNGLFGGHSGGDIHLPRGNAIKLLARILAWGVSCCPLYLGTWKGGSKHNAIPRSSTAKIAVAVADVSKFKAEFQQTEKLIKDYYDEFEQGLEISLASCDPFPVMESSLSKNIVSFLHQIPHGALKFSPQVEGLVETSNNVAIVKTLADQFVILCSSRSNLDSELSDFRLKLKIMAEQFGWTIAQDPAYPGWKPDPKSPFLHYVSSQFNAVLPKPVQVAAIHAGLECGVIGAKIPGIQMLSIGPDVENPHTPEERVNIASVKEMYTILKRIVMHLSEYK